MENVGTGVRNVLIASVIGSILGFFEGFCLVAVTDIAYSLANQGYRFESSYNPMIDLFVGLLCGAPPGVLGGFIGGFLGGLTCLKPDTPIRQAVIRGALGGFIFGLCGAGLGYMIRGSLG